MRRRYVQIEGILVECSSDQVQSARGGGSSGDAALWNDRIYQDGGDQRFTSRTQHREFMKQNGLTTIDDFTDTWRDDERRKLHFRETGHDPARKQQIIDAVHQLESQRRR